MICEVCGNKNKFTPLFPSIVITKNYVCEKCGHVFIADDLKTDGTYYKDDGYFKKSPNKGLRKDIISKGLLVNLGNERIKHIKKVLPDFDFTNKKILDVGCGHGQILYILKTKFNCRVLGIEPSMESANIGKDMFDVEILPILLEEYNKADKFDLIICAHTLEHVPEVRTFLKKLKSLLLPKGVLYIEVPNLFKPTGGFTLNSFMYNEHIRTFSNYSLERLVTSEGFYLMAYNQDSFLHFAFGVSKTEKTSKLFEPVTAISVVNFLQSYNNTYTLYNYFIVYFNKFKYLCKALYFKYFAKAR